MEIRAGRGGGDWVQDRGSKTINATYGGGGRIEERKENIQKTG